MKKLNIEVLIMYVLSVLVFCRSGLEILRLILLGAVLMKLSLEDVKSYKLPDGIIMIGCAVSLLRLFEGNSAVELASGVIPAIFVLVPVLICDLLIKKSTLGGGDIKMIAMIGLNFGFSETLSIILFAGVLFLIVYLLNDRQQNLPFGPLLSLAAWIVAIK